MEFVKLNEKNNNINNFNEKYKEENILINEKNYNNLNLFSSYETSLYKVKYYLII